MDLWEANSISTAYTPHPCSKPGLVACTGNDCGDGDNRYGGICDKDGCDFNVSLLRRISVCNPNIPRRATAWASRTSTARA